MHHILSAENINWLSKCPIKSKVNCDCRLQYSCQVQSCSSLTWALALCNVVYTLKLPCAWCFHIKLCHFALMILNHIHSNHLYSLFIESLSPIPYLTVYFVPGYCSILAEKQPHLQQLATRQHTRGSSRSSLTKPCPCNQLIMHHIYIYFDILFEMWSISTILVNSFV